MTAGGQNQTYLIPKGPPIPLGRYDAPDGSTIFNSSKNANDVVWISDSPGFAAGQGHRLGALGTVKWKKPGVVPYAVLDPGATGTVNGAIGVIVNVLPNIEDPVNPVDVGIAVATQLLLTGVPSVLLSQQYDLTQTSLMLFGPPGAGSATQATISLQDVIVLPGTAVAGGSVVRMDVSEWSSVKLSVFTQAANPDNMDLLVGFSDAALQINVGHINLAANIVCRHWTGTQESNLPTAADIYLNTKGKYLYIQNNAPAGHTYNIIVTGYNRSNPVDYSTANNPSGEPANYTATANGANGPMTKANGTPLFGGPAIMEVSAPAAWSGFIQMVYYGGDVQNGGSGVDSGLELCDSAEFHADPLGGLRLYKQVALPYDNAVPYILIVGPKAGTIFVNFTPMSQR